MRLFFVGMMILFLFMVEAAFSEEGFEYDAKGKRDPFVPLISDTGAYVSDAYGISNVKDIRLEGIVWDDRGDSIAIINGEIIKEGEGIGSVKLLKIEENSVIFDVEGEMVRVELRTD